MAIPVQAEPNGDIDLQEGQLVLGEMTVRDLTQEEQAQLDAGEAEALVFDSEEAFQAYMDQRQAQTIDITGNIEEKPSIGTCGLSDVSSRTIGVDPIPLPPVYINCQFQYTSSKNASGQWYFTGISNIQSWLTGIQFPVNYSWDQKAGTYTYSNSNKNVRITCSGVLGTHIIIEGIGKILDQNMSYSFDYLARQ